METMMQEKIYENYGIYRQLVDTGKQVIRTLDFTTEDMPKHIESIINILRDGIETDEVQSMMLTVIFSDGYDVDLYITDYLFNLIHWSMIVSSGNAILPQHIFFPENITNRYIKRYIDTWLQKFNYAKINKILLNNIANDCLGYYRYVNEFAMWIANTLCLEDDVKLINECKEAYDIMHSDLSNCPLDQLKDVAMERTYRLIDIIKNSDHCLNEMLRTGEGINPKQYRENAVNVGPKPNGEGGIFSSPINSNLLYLGALSDLTNAVIEYSAGLQAQIINKTNVDKSGTFARLLKLNCMDVQLNHDPKYVCSTKNFVKITVKNKELANRFDGMTFRFNPKGIDYVFDSENNSVIGQTVYFRTPMTCESYAHGKGICHACYGRLAYMNSDVNVGVIASELFSSDLTQMLLSAKHLLEADVKSLHWINDNEFWKIFSLDGNEIQINSKFNTDGYKLVIDLEEDIMEMDDYDDLDFNLYINELKIMDSNGNILLFGANSDESDNVSTTENLYITLDFNMLLRDKSKGNKKDNDILEIPLSKLTDISLFLLNISNTELSHTLDSLQRIIDISKITSKYDKDSILQDLVETTIKSRLSVGAIHSATILAAQIRSVDDILEVPDWSNPDEPYTILALKSALSNSPSITKTLSYSYIKRLLISPISFRKTKPSEMDLFFMEQPQKYLDKDYVTEEGPRELVRFINK